MPNLGEAWTQGSLLPIYVVLRDFAAKLPTLKVEEDETPLWKFITQHMGRSLHDFIPLLNDHLLTEGGILIVDGFDEVSDVDQQLLSRGRQTGYSRFSPSVPPGAHSFNQPHLRL